MTLAEIIKEGRRRQFLTQQGLAEALGVSLNAVQRWELGLAIPHPKTQRRLIEILELDREQFLAAHDAATKQRAGGKAAA